jgi:hypothetical protein
MLSIPRRTVGALLSGTALAAVMAAPAAADILFMFSRINAAQEVPPNPSTATGVGNMRLDTDLDTIDYQITFSGLTSSEISAHFHGFSPPGMNSGIQHVLPLGSPKTGTFNYGFTPAEETMLINGLTYTNIHSVMFGAGEIRGQNLVTAESNCWGDGSGTACPCGNTGTKGRGCANSTGMGGLLEPTGSNTISGNDLALHGSSLLPGQPALLFVGNDLLPAASPGDGIAFGDGLRCAGNNVRRLGVMVPTALGQTTWGPGLNAAGGWGAGDTRHLQGWYRNPTGPCGSGFNLTNAISVTFAP